MKRRKEMGMGAAIKKVIVFSILILICSFLISCRKNPCSDNDVVNNVTLLVPDGEKQNIPFSGNDTLIYFSDAGDTAILYGQGISTYFTEIFQQEGTLECPKGTKFNNENINYKMNGINSELPSIHFNIYTENEALNPFIIFKINSISYRAYAYHLNSISYYTDSVDIENKIYYGAHFIAVNHEFDLLYNYHYGFLQIKFKDGKNWKLKID